MTSNTNRGEDKHNWFDILEKSNGDAHAMKNECYRMQHRRKAGKKIAYSTHLLLIDQLCLLFTSVTDME